VRSISELKFIVDHNVGKLAKWLRMIGYDTTLFRSSDDSRMVANALMEGRVILTRDTQIMKRRVVTSGKLKTILIQSDKSELQIRQVIDNLRLDCQFRPFTICLECNQPLVAKNREDVVDLVPQYVFQTQHHYLQCPTCDRIYWRGTHWQSMTQKLERLVES
jgi:uncharacterized protein with PIN domain